MGGIESNPGPTNQETLIWLKNLTNMKFCESDLKAAKTFFGGFDGDRKQFSAWRDKFMNAHKKVKQETHMRLMRDCGGGGKKFDVPPRERCKKKLKKKLTNVSFMYVCVAENGEMLVFFLFSPNNSLIDNSLSE